MTKKEIDTCIEQWLNDDNIVFRKIFDYYYPRLFSVCIKSIRQNEDCEDIVMNTLLHIWMQREKMQRVNDFEKYIFAMLRYQIAGFYRQNILKTEVLENIPLDQLGTAEQPEATFRELQRLYVQAVNKLPEKRREVFLMSREQGMSHQQIAEQNNISINTVNNHIKSALKVLRDDLGEYTGTLSLLIMTTTMV